MVMQEKTKTPEDPDQRRVKLEALETRISRTPAGERFLHRVYEIGKPKPLRSESKEGE